jgi:hypothetical protein
MQQWPQRNEKPGSRYRGTALAKRPVTEVHWQGESGTLLLRAGTECENDRDNRAGAGLTI